VARREAASRTRPKRAELFDKDCERQLIRHLKTVCLWPARDRDRTWRLGDYSRYELQFDVPGRAALTVQFHSEPDERTGNGAVTFGISAQKSRRAGTPVLDAARQEMLRDHGFALSMRGSESSSGQYRKQVLVPGSRAVRALAREAIAILCKVLDYDGATPLQYRLHLGTRLSAGFAFDGICATDLLKLMHRWGFAAVELEERAILVAHAQARHRLAAIDVENPGGTPARSGDSGQKTGERYTIVVLLDYKAVGDVIVTIGLCHALHPRNSRDSTPRGSAVRVPVLYAKTGSPRRGRGGRRATTGAGR
jgi:hypothetical protein